MAIRSITSGAFFLIASTTIAFSQAANPIGTFRQWNAYTYSDAEGKSCYIAAQPQSSKYSREISGRDPVFFLVTTRSTNDPQKSVRNEVSVMIGYPFQANSTVTVDVDGRKFTMFTREDNAWFDDRNGEAAFVEAMKAGTNMVVEGTSSRGTVTTDTYSLSGVTAGLDAVAKECP